MNPTQSHLIDKIMMELIWWKTGSKPDVEEFVRHEIHGLTPDQENQVINGLNYIHRVVKNLKDETVH